MPKPAKTKIPTALTLIGMAGVGKSFVGRALAQRLAWRFIDVDQVIEQRCGQSLQQILDTRGEAAFLDQEEAAVLSLGDLQHSVVAPGGSVVYRPPAMAFLAQRSFIVYLYDDPARIRLRLSQPQGRGIVGLFRDDLGALYDQRQELYQTYAHARVNIPPDLNLEHILDAIIKSAGLEIP